jgi:hypothetical protein
VHGWWKKGAARENRKAQAQEEAPRESPQE